jgi:hypothetical protein
MPTLLAVPCAHLQIEVLRRPVEFALDTPVGMMDQAAEILVLPQPYRHLQRVERKI